MREYTNVTVTKTTDPSLPSFDNTRLVAINTCPTDGILRYTLNKRMSYGGRAMALEAGGAAHEVFAAHRLYHIREHGVGAYGLEPSRADEIFQSTGRKLFGTERFATMVGAINPDEDARTQRVAFSLTALYTGGFYDDPTDKKRTVTNIEELCIAYMDRFDWADELPIILNDGEFVGIEVPIDVTLEYTLNDGSIERYRFIGRADGLHWKDASRSSLRIHENKTASRLGDAWEASHTMSHQHTGYMIGLSAILGREIRNGLVLGTALPLPRAYNLNGISRVPVSRQDFEVIDWFDWFLHTVHLHERYKNEPTNAPHYTHSCNRYFRPCAFIPFCASPPEDRVGMIEEMHTEVWSPLHETGEPTDE
ncbi:MAG: hypothetical protein KKH61_21260 [Gammaproteobacteria bacterium]|uniref:PD-(D/E)XK nuclease superfamily protein n=1 Tax=viral metagenome TaxID=1070528 RepID=A0A6H1ZAP9_9ZZZZ|nr:hypothetical protein [Gammaproteobacteria bacterium]